MTLSSAERAPIVSDGDATPSGKRTVKQDGYWSDQYQARKEAGVCTRCGDPNLDDDTQVCAACRSYLRQHVKSAIKRLRKARRKAKQCAYCGKASERYACPVCKVKTGRSPRRKQTVKQERIAARLIPWENSPQNVGRVRLRGGKKGRRSVGDENCTDFDQMEKDLVRARNSDEYLRSADVQQMPPIQRDEARRAAMDWVALVVRTGVELLVRNKHPIGKRYARAAQADHNIAVSDDDEET